MASCTYAVPRPGARVQRGAGRILVALTVALLVMFVRAATSEALVLSDIPDCPSCATPEGGGKVIDLAQRLQGGGQTGQPVPRPAAPPYDWAADADRFADDLTKPRNDPERLRPVQRGFGRLSARLGWVKLVVSRVFAPVTAFTTGYGIGSFIYDNTFAPGEASGSWSAEYIWYACAAIYGCHLNPHDGASPRVWGWFFQGRLYRQMFSEWPVEWGRHSAAVGLVSTFPSPAWGGAPAEAVFRSPFSGRLRQRLPGEAADLEMAPNTAEWPSRYTMADQVADLLRGQDEDTRALARWLEHQISGQGPDPLVVPVVPEIRPNETYEEYAERLRELGLRPRREYVVDITFEHHAEGAIATTPGAGARLQEDAEVVVRTRPRRQRCDLSDPVDEFVFADGHGEFEPFVGGIPQYPAFHPTFLTPLRLGNPVTTLRWGNITGYTPEWDGFGYRHIAAKHGWSAADRSATQEALSAGPGVRDTRSPNAIDRWRFVGPEYPSFRDGRPCVRVVSVEYGIGDDDDAPPGIITSYGRDPLA